MNIEGWAQFAITDLDTLWDQAKSVGNPPIELIPLANGVRGFWKDISPNEIVNVIGTLDEMVAFYNTYQSEIISLDCWNQGPGFDAIEVGLPLTDSDRILSFMPDFINTEGGSTPPTKDKEIASNKNWNNIKYFFAPIAF